MGYARIIFCRKSKKLPPAALSVTDMCSDDSVDERLHSCHSGVSILDWKAEFLSQSCDWLDPVCRHVERRWPRVGAASTEYRLARVAKSLIVGNQCFHEQEIDQIAKPLVALAGPGCKRHVVEFSAQCVVEEASTGALWGL